MKPMTMMAMGIASAILGRGIKRYCCDRFFLPRCVVSKKSGDCSTEWLAFHPQNQAPQIKMNSAIFRISIMWGILTLIGLSA
jgi:hypothetical protein